MKYFLQRDGRSYGPYSFDDLKRYETEGRIGPNDMVRVEGEEQWQPASQILHPSLAVYEAPPAAPVDPPASTPIPDQPPQPVWPPAAPALPPTGMPPYGAPAAPMVSAGPMPPSLHWGIVLILSILTCGVFALVWNFIQASFVKKIDPQSKGILYLCILLGLTAVSIAASVGMNAANLIGMGESGNPNFAVLAGAMSIQGVIFVVSMLVFVLYFLNIRESLVRYYNSVENIGLQISLPTIVILSIFCSLATYYVQYHLTRIANWKQTGRFY